MAVDDGRRGSGFAGDAKENRSDIAGGRSDGGHAEQEGKGFDGVHLENKRQHERHRGGTAESGQDADDEADRNADQHQIEGRQVKHCRNPETSAFNISMTT